MTYELALELKYAGWPQPDDYQAPAYCSNGKRPRWRISSFDDENECLQCGEKPFGSHILIPTLSELVEACGADFNVLKQGEDHVWFCGHIDWDVEDFIVESEGFSPEESVAKLWLALNKSHEQ